MARTPVQDLMAHPPVSAFEDEKGKPEFHRAAARYLRHLAKLLRLPGDSYAVRSNKAGPAVSGEVVLHGEWIYMYICGSCVSGPGALVRACRGQKDYHGGPNNWLRWDQLKDVDAVATFINRFRSPERA